MQRQLNIFVSHPSHLLTDSLPHGDGLVANQLLRRLADRGHNLHVAVSRSELAKAMPSNVNLYQIHTKVAHTNEHQGLAYRAEYAFRVRRLFAKLRQTVKIDVIHQMNPVVGGVSLLLYGLGCPLLMGPLWPLWASDPDQHGVSRRARHAIRDKLLAGQFLRADGILSTSPASEARLPGSVLASNRSFQFDIGVDTEQFVPDDSERPRVPTILFLANMMERKGVFVLLSAFEEILASLPAAKLILAGDGVELTEVRRRIDVSPYKNQVLLLGPVEREAVPSVLRACSVYCLPSFGEPYGMSALEAMSCGKALVVTNAGGLAHLVPDPGSVKVPMRDVSALAKALLSLLKNDRLQQQMGSFNRDYVEKHHSWERVVTRLEEIYYEIIDRSLSLKRRVGAVASGWA